MYITIISQFYLIKYIPAKGKAFCSFCTDDRKENEGVIGASLNKKSSE